MIENCWTDNAFIWETLPLVNDVTAYKCLCTFLSSLLWHEEAIYILLGASTVREHAIQKCGVVPVLSGTEGVTWIIKT